jgi:hypothetical protein
MKVILSFAALWVLASCVMHAVSPSPNWAELRTELEQMFKADQDKRVLLNRMLEEKPVPVGEAAPPEMSQLMNEIRDQDKVNQARVTALLDGHGWIGESRVGSLAGSTVFLVIQHSPLDMQLKYLPMMRKAAQAGDLNKRSLAMTEDRVLVRQGKPQIYGSQVDPKKSGVDLFPVVDPDNLDARRKEVGLPPICEYLQKFVKAHGAITYPGCAK